MAAASRLGPGDYLLPPIVTSTAVLRWADLPALRPHPAGRYAVAQMPPAAAAVRLAGDAVMT